MADVKVYNDLGQFGSIPSEELEFALNRGYRVATEEDLKKETLRKEYGGASDEALAAISGVAKGLTFGLSDVAIAGLGGDEALKAYDALYGGERIAGEVAGAILPMFFTGGGSAVARGAATAAEGAKAAEAAVAAARAAEAAKGGGSVLSAAGKALTAIPRAADATGAAARSALGLANRPILGSAVQLAVSGAVENSIQAAGNEAARLAIDNELAGEKLGQIFLEGLKGGGIGLAAGGILGGGAGALGAAISKTGDKLRRIGYATTSEAAEELATKPGIREQAFKYLSKIKNADESVGARLANDAEALKAARLADDVIETNVEKLTGDLTDYYGRADQLSSFGRSSTKKFEAASDLLPRGQDIDANGLPFSWADRQVSEFERIAQPIEGDIERILDKANKAEFNPIEAAPLQKRIEKAREKIASAAPDQRGLIAAQEMNSLKQTIDQRYLSMSASKNIRVQNTAPIWQSWGTALRNSLEDEAVFGGLAKFQREVNDGLEKMLDVQRYLKSEWLTEFKKSKVDWTRKDYVAAGSKVRNALKSTTEVGVNVPVQALKETVQGDKEWLTVLLRDGKLSASERKLVQDQLDSIPRILDNLDEAKRIAEGGAWYKKVSGQGDPLLAAVAGGAALGPAGLLLAPIVRPQIALRGLELTDKVARGELGKIGTAVARTTNRMVATTKRVPKAAVVGLEKQREFDRQRAIVAQIAQQAPAIKDAVARQTGWIGQTAPNAHRVGADTVIRGALYLDSKAPGKQVSSTPFSRPMPPTRQEIAEFNRRARAVRNPMVLLDDLEAGRLTPETVEAVREVYPETFAEIQARLAEKIASMSEKGQTPSIGDRVQLSLVMGAPMTPEMEPEFIRTAQSIYAQQTPEERQGTAPSRGASPAPNFAANYESGAQATAQAQ